MDVAAVLLDVGGVFHLPSHDRVTAALARVGVEVDPAELDRAHYVGVASLSDFVEGDRDIWITYNRAYARACGVPDDIVETAAESLLSEFTTGGIWSRIVPGSVEALRELAGLDVHLAIVSNADGAVEAELRDESVCQVGPGPGVTVGAILDSSVVGVAKPDPAIFGIALERLGGVDPAHAVHVGDTPAADVAGARAAGVHPLLLDPYDLHAGLDVDRVTSLADVVEFVRARLAA